MEYLATPKGKRIYSIYKATNLVNKKVYIGFDSNWPKRRNQHKNNFLRKEANTYNCIFHKALRKHGWDNFEWEVIYEHWDGEYTLNVLEPYFIDVYDSYKNGYNLTKGGDGSLGYIQSKQTRLKRSKSLQGHVGWNLGKKFSIESRKKCSESQKGSIKSIETKSKISKSKIGKSRSKETIEKMSKAFSKHWLLIDPNGNKYKITNLFKFCKDNPQYKLNSSNLYSIANKNLNYKGWIIKNQT